MVDEMTERDLKIAGGGGGCKSHSGRGSRTGPESIGESGEVTLVGVGWRGAGGRMVRDDVRVTGWAGRSGA
jgi:hypothetical protein